MESFNVMKKNVLYINHETCSIGGCTYSLVNMLNAVKDFVNPIVLFRSRGVAFDYMTGLGFKTIMVPFKLNIVTSSSRKWARIPRKIRDNVINNLALFQLQKIVKDNNIQIIHSNTSVFTIGLQLAKKMKIPHVWHLREYQNLDFNMRPFCGWEKFYKLLHSSDAIISITKPIEKHFKIPNRSNTIVLFDAVRSSEEVSYKPKEKFFLFCGRVCKAKGIEDAIDIFSKFCEKDNSFSLKIAGLYDLNYKENLLTKVKGSKAEGKLEFLGFCDDIKKLMLYATSLLMTSICEAQGRVTVEALFYGCPVLGRNSGGTKEIIQDGINGLLFEDTEEAVNKLLELVHNQEKTISIIENGHKTAINFFSEESYGQKIDVLYNQLLK